MRQQAEVVVHVAAEEHGLGCDVQVLSETRRTSRNVGEVVDLKPALLAPPAKLNRVDQVTAVHWPPGEYPSWT